MKSYSIKPCPAKSFRKILADIGKFGTTDLETIPANSTSKLTALLEDYFRAFLYYDAYRTSLNKVMVGKEEIEISVKVIEESGGTSSNQFILGTLELFS